MPRRLGDDPLSRKKKPGDAVSAQSGAAALQTSHNDVFFRRRSESASQRIPGPEKVADTEEGPEITEVGELVKTAQAAISTQGAGQLAEPMPTVQSTQPAVAEEEAEASPTVPEPSTAIEPSHAAAEDPPSPDQPQSEPEKSGFFKRLFGRLGK